MIKIEKAKNGFVVTETLLTHSMIDGKPINVKDPVYIANNRIQLLEIVNDILDYKL